MSTNPDEIRADIERTRAELGRDVDALAEKVSPAKAVERQKDRLRDRVSSVAQSVMGTPEYDGRYDDTGSGQSGLRQARDKAGDLAHQASDRVSHLADEAGHAVQQAPAQIRRQTRGNPLAAGLIAFGAGWLVGSLIPASRVEQDAAQTVKERAAPVVDEAKSVAREMGEHLQPQAQDAVESVKDSATSGAEQVKAQGQSRADDLKQQSERSAQRVKDESQQS